MFAVQLCASAPCTEATLTQYTKPGTYVWEPKHDGLRAVLVVNNGAVRIWNRNHNEITHQWPDVVAAAAAKWPDHQVILDGELVVNDSDGRPNFKLTATRGKQTKPPVIKAHATRNPGTFHAFDLLYVDGEDMRKRIMGERRAMMIQLVPLFEPHTTNRIVHDRVWDDGFEAMQWVLENKREGLVVKRLHSTYQAGARTDWIKVKPTFTVSCIVTGFEGGSGARSATFGALRLALLNEDGERVAVGKVGSGFNGKDLLEVQALLQDPATSDTIVVEVEYQEFTQDGSLRFPVYRGLRTDQTINDCTLDQVLPAQEATP